MFKHHIADFLKPISDLIQTNNNVLNFIYIEIKYLVKLEQNSECYLT